MNYFHLWFVALSCGFAIAPAAAQFPLLTGTLALELDNKSWLDGPDHDKRHDLFGFSEADVSLRLTESFLLRAVATLEPLTDPHPQSNRAFQNEDVRWKDVYFQYDDKTMGFRGGRITANFGSAWYAAPGLDATTLAEDYAIWDRMGASAWYRQRSDSFGTMTFSASTFSLDTSALSASWLNTRHRRTREQGGPSNTGSPTSFAVSVDGSSIRSLPGLSWQLALLKQDVDFRVDSTGQRDYHVTDEKGAAANIQQMLKMGDRIESSTLVEAAYLKDRSGVPGASARYLSVGETLRFGQWYAQAALTVRWLESELAQPSRDFLQAFTAGYNFTDRLLLDAGWRKTSISSTANENLRVRIRYVIAF